MPRTGDTSATAPSMPRNVSASPRSGSRLVGVVASPTTRDVSGIPFRGERSETRLW